MYHDFESALQRLARARLHYEDVIASNASMAAKFDAREQLHEARMTMARLRSRIA